MTRLARYQPPSIPPQVLVALVVIFALLSFIRGLDYALSGDVAQSLVVLNALGNLHLWGVMIMLAATAVITSYALRRHFLIWLAHVIMAALRTRHRRHGRPGHPRVRRRRLGVLRRPGRRVPLALRPGRPDPPLPPRGRAWHLTPASSAPTSSSARSRSSGSSSPPSGTPRRSTARPASSASKTPSRSATRSARTTPPRSAASSRTATTPARTPSRSTRSSTRPTTRSVT
ncbi:hypothetical protein [Nocardioides convexus]|uniref:hypothetical protein n=1 Tax=Nocardioides convexus TaxID=2712224 RepID=UPI0024183835|nr:hypothetical protein [Nocardioides convexus]